MQLLDCMRRVSDGLGQAPRVTLISILTDVKSGPAATEDKDEREGDEGPYRDLMLEDQF